VPVDDSEVIEPMSFLAPFVVTVPVSTLLEHSRLPALVTKIRSELLDLISSPALSAPDEVFRVSVVAALAAEAATAVIAKTATTQSPIIFRRI